MLIVGVLLPVHDCARFVARRRARLPLRIESRAPPLRETSRPSTRSAFAGGNDWRAVVLGARLEKSDVREHAAVADGETILVTEDDLVALAMARAHERRRRDADAHAADAGEVGVPRVRECRAAPAGNFLLLQLGQHARAVLSASGSTMISSKAGTRVELRTRGVIHAPRQIGLHLAPEIRLGEAQARAARRLRTDKTLLARVGIDVDVALLVARKRSRAPRRRSPRIRRRWKVMPHSLSAITIFTPFFSTIDSSSAAIRHRAAPDLSAPPRPSRPRSSRR